MNEIKTVQKQVYETTNPYEQWEKKEILIILEYILNEYLGFLKSIQQDQTYGVVFLQKLEIKLRKLNVEIQNLRDAYQKNNKQKQIECLNKWFKRYKEFRLE
jgi:TolA-binding protein